MASSPKSVWQDSQGFIVVSRKRISFILSAVFSFTGDIGGVLNRMRRPAKTDFAPAHIPEPKMWFFVISRFLNVLPPTATQAEQTCR